jgi:hypothetical protein
LVAGAAYSKELQHQPDDKVPWYNLGFRGGVVVAGTAYSESML